MNREAKCNQNMLIAYEKGYRILPDGSIQGIEKIRKGTTHVRNGTTYLRFTAKAPGNVRITVDAHKLAAYQKYGEAIFEDGIEVRHLDNNSLNNAEENIAIGTHQENELDKPVESRLKYAINASERIRKFTDTEMEEIRLYRKNGATYNEIMNKFTISSKGTLHHILNNDYVTKK